MKKSFHTLPGNSTCPESQTSTFPRRLHFLPMAAIGCFGAACVLSGAAASLALSPSAASGAAPALVACAALVSSVSLAGLGLLLTRRGQQTEVQETKKTGHMEHVQHELDLLGLTPKEMAIAKLILQHRSYDDIAQRLGIASRTVQFHASNIYHKAYVSRRRDFERLILAEATNVGGSPFEVIPRLRPEQALTDHRAASASLASDLEPALDAYLER